MSKTQEKHKYEDQLTPDFVLELFANMLKSSRVFETVRPHLEFEHLPTNSHKQLLDFLRDFYDLNHKLPTYGILAETYKTNTEVTAVLAKIRAINTYDEDTYEELLEKLEEFLKRAKFLDLHKRVTNLWNEGKTGEAISLMAQNSEAIVAFTIKSKYYKGLFSHYEERMRIRMARADHDNVLDYKVLYGIHELNYHTRGGGALGTSCLILARSGVGKTTCLRWMGISAARSGKRVIHFQAEGSEADCFEGYDAAWTAQNTVELESGIAPDPTMYSEAKRFAADGGEVYVFASEQFDSMPIEHCRDKIMEIEKIYGKVDLVLYDYLELFTVGNSRNDNSQYGERKKRDDLGKKITNMAIEFNHHAVAATQTNDISPDIWNDGTKVLTKNNIAEHKGLVRHFAYFFTLNQTNDEYDAGIMRIYIDKLRKYKGQQTIHIVQSRDNGRFYDAWSTLGMFWDDLTKKRREAPIDE